MDITRKIYRGIKNPKEIPPYCVEHFILRPTQIASIIANSRFSIGKNVYEEDWDVLIILDGCRYDTMKDVKDEYDFISDVDKYASVGSHSTEWIANTFDRRYKSQIGDSAYITSNMHSSTVLENRLEHFRDPSHSKTNRLKKWGTFDFVTLDEMGSYEPVWKFKFDKPFQDKFDGYTYRHVSPRAVTDRAIDLIRHQNFNQYILHYMFPHSPYIGRGMFEGRDPKKHELSTATMVREKGVRETYEVFLDNLRWILDEEISLLLENIDAESVVLTADHGTAFWRFSSHTPGSLHPKVRFVPWVTTTANDLATHEPSFIPDEDTDYSAEEQLETLGYL